VVVACFMGLEKCREKQQCRPPPPRAREIRIHESSDVVQCNVILSYVSPDILQDISLGHIYKGILSLCLIKHYVMKA
jgi:hypothetical protein